ncbi:phosphoribosyltransferase [Bradyrhizobium sp. CB1650]|uniref:phosphoribosyltransferase n=1 Tax=Bradyrhizobium sp. CB1650 TaxID=3039153 RepID=UPI0024360B72|nr:phosphoribosyltransferase [Bradyrhizobium sp. CB1650]WGD54162.1 phosphoribosyltransferase [Bradyrhizobium sp. CB1650]
MSASIIREHRKALLACTSLTFVVPPKDTSPRFFGKSAYISRRFEYVAEAEFASTLGQFASLIGKQPTEFAELAKHKIHRFKLEEFKRDLAYLQPASGEDPIAAELRKFFAGQLIFTILEDVRDQQKTYPPIVKRIFREAAEGLFEFGRDQAVALAEVADDLIKWMQRRRFARVIILEMPVGNCVPVEIVRRIAVAHDINVDVVEWAFPRNTAKRGGYTVRDAAQKFAEDPRVVGADCILLLDDVLTGSRLLNIAEALRRAVGKERLAVVGLHFTFPRGSRKPPYPARNLTRFDGWATQMEMPFGNKIMPTLPLFKGDQGDDFFLESPSVWIGSDLIVGKRKVNLLYNKIDFYEQIARDLASDAGKYLRSLKHSVWSEDEGGIWQFGSDIVEATFRRIFSKLSIDQLFRDVRSEAATDFPADQSAIDADLGERVMRERVDWLVTTIKKSATSQLSEQEAGTLVRAILETSNAGLNVSERRIAKDHAYGHYTSPYNATVRTLNERLCDLIASLAGK